MLCLISSLLPFLGFPVAGSLKEQFFPSAERDHFHFSVRLPTPASVQETERVSLAARDVVMKHPEVEEITLFVGRAAPKMHYSMVALEDNRPNYAQGLVQLNSPNASAELVQEIQDELDEQILEAQCVVTRIEQGPPPLHRLNFDCTDLRSSNSRNSVRDPATSDGSSWRTAHANLLGRRRATPWSGCASERGGAVWDAR